MKIIRHAMAYIIDMFSIVFFCIGFGVFSVFMGIACVLDDIAQIVHGEYETEFPNSLTAQCATQYDDIV